jgi:hypothetical protein
MLHKQIYIIMEKRVLFNTASFNTWFPGISEEHDVRLACVYLWQPQTG